MSRFSFFFSLVLATALLVAVAAVEAERRTFRSLQYYDGNITTAHCFPMDGQVDVESGETISMQQLKVGTKVHVGNGIFEPVLWMDYHYDGQGNKVKDVDQWTQFVQVHTEQDGLVGPTLTLTPNHMVIDASTNALTAAKDITINTLLFHGVTGRPLMVKNVQIVVKQGTFNAVTRSGKLVVDNVLVSIYTVDTASMHFVGQMIVLPVVQMAFDHFPQWVYEATVLRVADFTARVINAWMRVRSSSEGITAAHVGNMFVTSSTA